VTELNMAKLNRLLCVCVGAVWIGAGLAWVGTGLAIWDGNKAAAAGVHSAVGAVMAAITLTAAVGWFAWRRRKWQESRPPGDTIQ
jgi:hypothetical protein